MYDNFTVGKSTFKGLNVLCMLEIQPLLLVLKAELFSHLVEDNVEELELRACGIQTTEDFAFTVKP